MDIEVIEDILYHFFDFLDKMDFPFEFIITLFDYLDVPVNFFNWFIMVWTHIIIILCSVILASIAIVSYYHLIFIFSIMFLAICCLLIITNSIINRCLKNEDIVILKHLLNQFNEGCSINEKKRIDSICIICINNIPNYFAKKCGHYLFCRDCYIDNYSAIKKIRYCPICRKEVKEFDI